MPDDAVAGAEPPVKKPKRKRRNKKKTQDPVTNELLNNLDTDDLVDFINNCGSKKEDLKKNRGDSRSQVRSTSAAKISRVQEDYSQKK